MMKIVRRVKSDDLSPDQRALYDTLKQTEFVIKSTDPLRIKRLELQKKHEDFITKSKHFSVRVI